MKKQLYHSLRSVPKSAHVTLPTYQFNDKVANLCFFVALTFTLLSFVFIWINYSLLPAEIPLYFQRPWGQSQLAERSMIWLQPGLLLLFFLINYAISLFNVSKEPLTARILGGTVLVCSIMGLISLWNIVSLLVGPRLWPW